MITGNEPAMPIPGLVYLDGSSEPRVAGITIHQLFAAIAMNGILANSEFMRNHKDIDIHSLSVYNADHLIAELNK